MACVLDSMNLFVHEASSIFKTVSISAVFLAIRLLILIDEYRDGNWNGRICNTYYRIQYSINSRICRQTLHIYSSLCDIILRRIIITCKNVALASLRFRQAVYEGVDDDNYCSPPKIEPEKSIGIEWETRIWVHDERTVVEVYRLFIIYMASQEMKAQKMRLESFSKRIKNISKCEVTLLLI